MARVTQDRRRRFVDGPGPTVALTPRFLSTAHRRRGQTGRHSGGLSSNAGAHGSSSAQAICRPASASAAVRLYRADRRRGSRRGDLLVMDGRDRRAPDASHNIRSISDDRTTTEVLAHVETRNSCQSSECCATSSTMPTNPVACRSYPLHFRAGRRRTAPCAVDEPLVARDGSRSVSDNLLMAGDRVDVVVTFGAAGRITWRSAPRRIGPVPRAG